METMTHRLGAQLYTLQYNYYPCDGTVLEGRAVPAETLQLVAVFRGNRNVSRELDRRVLNKLANAALAHARRS
jgi:hypothetical protein